MSERTIFLNALDRPDPAERAAYMDEACAGEPALRQRVEALLRSHRAAGDFLATPALSPESAPIVGLDPQRLASVALGRLDHYELLEEAGRGGMGIVFKAHDEKLDRIVAVKILSPSFAASDIARERFIREARAAASVRDEHVVAIHAVGDGPLPYLVMEFVEGTTLEDRIKNGEPLPMGEILCIGAQIARGLAAAHACGLIHRDIKPTNILLANGTPRVKITDFGLARAAADLSLTQPGVIAGSPRHMSPEQARGEAIDHRTDLFSLGTVLYLLCTGRLPFQAENALAILRRISEDVPPPVREINPCIPEWLSAVVERLHAKDQARRFQSAAEVADLLGRRSAGSSPEPARRPWRVGFLLGALALATLGIGYLIRSATNPAGIGPSGPTAPALNDMNKEPRYFADPAHALVGVSDFRDIVGVNHQALLDWHAALEPGFRLALVTNRRGKGLPLFNAVAIREKVPHRIRFSPGLIVENHQKDWDDNRKDGFGLLGNCVSDRLDGQPGQQVARIWIKDEVARPSWSGSLAAVREWVAGTKDEPSRPVYLESRPAHGDAPWHATAADQQGVKWELLSALTPGELAQWVELHRRKNWRPDVLAACWDEGRTTFALVSVDNKDGPDWCFRMDMAKQQYEKESRERRQAGWFPLALASYGDGDEARYVAVWVRGWAPGR